MDEEANYPPEDDNDPFGWKMHKKHAPTHGDKYGHYCDEFDGLWICEDCDEYEVCNCVFGPDFPRIK